MAKTINSLTIAFKAITSPQQDERVIFNLQKSFLDVASLVLLRMAKQNDKDKKAPVDYPSMVIFLDLVRIQNRKKELFIINIILFKKMNSLLKRVHC